MKIQRAFSVGERTVVPARRVSKCLLVRALFEARLPFQNVATSGLVNLIFDRLKVWSSVIRLKGTARHGARIAYNVIPGKWYPERTGTPLSPDFASPFESSAPAVSGTPFLIQLGEETLDVRKIYETRVPRCETTRSRTKWSRAIILTRADTIMYRRRNDENDSIDVYHLKETIHESIVDELVRERERPVSRNIFQSYARSTELTRFLFVPVFFLSRKQDARKFAGFSTRDNRSRLSRRWQKYLRKLFPTPEI